MKIKPALNIERDENGFWTHPDFPEWEEGVTQYVISEWEKHNSVDLEIEKLEYSDLEHLIEAWFEGNTNDCSEWQPQCNAEGAFLLSIHDSEGGPVALFAVPRQEPGAA